MPKARRAPQPQGAVTNARHSDREMLANISAARDPDGWASTTAIAIECGFSPNGNHRTPATKVASRLSWMRDGGLLESAPPDSTKPYKEPGDRDTRWRLTDIGELILRGTLSKTASGAFERMDAGAQLLAMRQLLVRGYVGGEVPVAFALRREFQHQLAQRTLRLR